MAKKQKQPLSAQPYQHSRGVIRDNAICALLHDSLFRQRIEKKGKEKAVINAKPSM